MPEATADKNALAVVLLLAIVGLTVMAWRLFRGRNGPLLTFLMGVNRLYLGFLCRWSANRRDPLPDSGAVIVVANHTSPLDPLILQCGTDRLISFMMAREYFRVRWLQWLYRLDGAIPVNRTGRDTGATKAALRTLKQGRVLGVFPEGRINVAGRGLLEPRPGIALIALRSRATIVPAYITGAPIGRTMVAPFFTPCRVHVSYGEPLELSAYYGRERDREVLAEVTDRLMSALADAGGFRWHEHNLEDSEPAQPTRRAAR